MQRAALLLLLSACVAPPRTGPPERLERVVFSRYTPLSRPAEIARRTLTPLNVRLAARALATRREVLREQAIDLSKEAFTLYVPAGPAPKDGWGLLVFVSPLDEPVPLQAFRGPLARHGLIFVSALGSGNDSPVLDRRLPLALLAWENVRAAFPIDPKRVYAGGFSGGSRVAEIAALAYPDVFKGALLNAGSEPIGGEQRIYKPPADLFRQFQHTRLVYVTGDADERNLHDDAVSRDSMREWCVLDVEVRDAHHLGHQWLDAPSLERALEALGRAAAADPAALQRCNEDLQRKMAARLGEIEAAIARGDPHAAALLKSADARFAGLAAARLLELDAKLRR